METVSVIRCPEYEPSMVEAAIRRALEEIGGIESFIKPGDKVLLKLNLLMRKNPADAVTTHPVFAEALAKIVQRAGGIVTIADSPGGPYNETLLKAVYKGCGISDVAQRLGVNLNYDTSYQEVPFPKGTQVGAFQIIQPVLEADKIITVPKLKTHMMTFYSGAVKNLFGCIPGLYKAEYHFSMPQQEDFCNMLLDLCECVRPVLAVMDGIWGMEGQGPSGGIPRKFGAVLASASPYALDLAATRMVGITPQEAPTVSLALARGLCESEVKLTGDPIQELQVADLVKPPLGTPDFLKRKWLPEPVSNALNRWLSPKPEFDYQICVGCGECVRCCPAKALRLEEKRPVLETDKCIKCFCCQELCPKRAIHAKRSWLMRHAVRY